jgi:tight adherence protein B
VIAAALGAALVLLVGARLRPRPLRCATLAPTRPAPAPVRSRAGRHVELFGRRRRRRLSGPDDLAAWCDRLARAVRGGATLPAAVRRSVPPDDTRVRPVITALEHGLPLRAALAQVDPAADLDVVTTVLDACAASGGSAAEPLDRAAAALRGRAAEAAERRTHSAQARLSALVMTVIPIAMLVVLLVTAASVRDVVRSPLGGLVVTIGGALNLAGWRWMRRQIERAAP